MVRVLINGTPFHYGRAMLSYEPLHDYNQVDIQRVNEPIINNIHLSQRPHIYLNPTESQGGCMCLPYLLPDNYVANAFNSDYFRMGELTLSSFGDLLHANDADDPITVSIFAWANDVKLSVPTYAEVHTLGVGVETNREDGPAIAPFPEEEAAVFLPQADEYGQGIISKPASAIAAAAGMLAAVPIIGPFATATAIAASAVSSIAHIFGFSRPVVVEDQKFIKNQIMGNMANCDAPETVTKLSVDSKQELTVDGSTLGLTTDDELSFAYLAKRESYITSFPWNMSAAPETNLFSTWVVPTIFGQAADGSYHLTPMGFVALPFDSWCGTLIFRFQIIASNFHRGRLRIVYEPTVNTVSVTENNYNTNYNRIIDLSQERDFEIAVSWAQPEAYQRVFPVQDESMDSVYTTTSLNVMSNDYHNGNLNIKVLNELTAPSVNANVSVNVFVRAGDDFEVCNPTTHKLRQLSYFEPQSEEIFLPQASDEVEEEGTPDDNAPSGTSAMAESIGAPLAENIRCKKNLVFFGETITSFRTLMRRYACHMVHTPDNWGSATYEIIQWKIGMKPFPLYRGYDLNDGIHQTNSGHRYNYVNISMINYVTPAYVCRRGGIRFKFLCESSDINQSWFHSAKRTVSSGPYESAVRSLHEEDFSRSQTARIYVNAEPTGLGGQYCTAAREQPCVEIEVPFYSRYRFAMAKTLQIDTGLGRDDTDLMRIEQNIHGTSVDVSSGDTANIMCSQYVAAGEDYSCFFFLNVPQMWYYTNPSADT